MIDIRMIGFFKVLHCAVSLGAGQGSVQADEGDAATAERDPKGAYGSPSMRKQRCGIIRYNLL